MKTPVTLFHIAQVDVHFGAVMALRQVNLQVSAGQRLALIGANGSGKSTLLRVLHGLLPVSVGGQMSTHASVRRAMLFQQPHMLRLTALSNVAMAAWLNKQGQKQGQMQGQKQTPWYKWRRWTIAKQQAHAALARVGLTPQAQQQAHTLSLGQQQRLALARAWVMQPNVLLLDEPTARMDPHAKREVEALMQAFCTQPDMTLVFASHNLGQVKRLATHVAYLERGQLLVCLPVDEFFDADVLRTACPQADLFLQGEFS